MEQTRVFLSPEDAKDREAFAVAQIAATLFQSIDDVSDVKTRVKMVRWSIALLQESRRQLAATAQELP